MDPNFQPLVTIEQWTFIFQIGNLLLLTWLIQKFLFKPVKKMIDDRQKEIDDLYADADKVNAEAAALKEDYERHLADARNERDEILGAAPSRAQKREQEIISEAKADAAAIRTKAEADIAQEKKKALNEVKNEISVISMEIASKVVEREIKTADHAKLVEEFIGKLGEGA